MQTTAVNDASFDAILGQAFADIMDGINDSLRQMYKQQLDEGEVSVKFKISLQEKEVPYPTQTSIGGMRQISEPAFDYKVVSSVVLKNEQKGRVNGEGYEVDFDSTGAPVLKKLYKAQVSMFDEDSASNWGHTFNSDGEITPQIAGEIQGDENDDLDEFDDDDEFDIEDNE